MNSIDQRIRLEERKKNEHAMDAEGKRLMKFTEESILEGEEGKERRGRGRGVDEEIEEGEGQLRPTHFAPAQTIKLSYGRERAKDSIPDSQRLVAQVLPSKYLSRFRLAAYLKERFGDSHWTI